jgi:hypothetical protein
MRKSALLSPDTAQKSKANTNARAEVAKQNAMSSKVTLIAAAMFGVENKVIWRMKIS